MKKSSHDRRHRRPGRPATGAAGSDTHHEHDSDDVRRLTADEALVEEELGDNDLAEAAVAVYDRIRPYLSTVLAAAGAAVAGLVVWSLIASQAEATRRQSWDACLSAMTAGEPNALAEVIRRYPGTDAARWAELLTADQATAEGAELLFVDRSRGESRLQAAVDLYTALIATGPKGLLAERAVFGLAKARECLGQLAEARRGYEAVAAEFPRETLAQVASRRAAELGRESTRQWYDWFAVVKPAAATEAKNANAAPAADPAAAPAAPGQ
ncbi:MAG: hypothetical protein RLZZ111_1767 [Planctomycetota bacterium]